MNYKLAKIRVGFLLLFHRLVHDRELQLHDGSRLLRWDRYDALKTKHGYTDHDLNSIHKIFRIDPKFYMIASATPPKSGAGKAKTKWLTPEMLSLFFYHQLPEMTLEEEMDVIASFVSIFKYSYF
jgi:hypothetical protein